MAVREEYRHFGFIAQTFAGKKLKTSVQKSNAGFYIGTWHPEMGPVSRESAEYFSTFTKAKEALDKGEWTQRFNP